MNSGQVDTKQKILNSASELFTTKGYNNTTIEDIVDLTGDITKGAVYYYFESKIGILEYLLANDFDRDFGRLGSGKTLNEKLKNYILDYMELSNIIHLVEALDIAKKNPEIIGKHIFTINDLISELKDELFKEMKDSSIKCEYIIEVIEFAFIYLNMCVVLNVRKLTKAEFMKKMNFVKDVCKAIKLDIFDDEIIGRAEYLYDEIIGKNNL
ncbi:MAG: TetR/AcrR family transcriptional regulator [Tissierellia bacterium]|nr:TetR/AcrR family transcriptional regulator [Tissierellia bacterium]